MTKNSIRYILGLTLAIGAFSSCKKTDLFPSTSIELSQSFRTMNDARAWNGQVYSSLRGRVGGGYTFNPDVQADQLNASLVFGNRNGNPHRWEGFLSDDGALSGAWAGYYSGINNNNIAIAGLPTIPTATPADEDSISRYIGQAHLARAYYYFELAQRFAAPFEPGTAATTPGVPLVLEYDLTNRPARASLQAVYDQILADIAEAKTRLASTPGTLGAYRFNINTVYALEARVRLNMQDWVGAKAAADFVINTGTYPLVTGQTGFTSIWVNDSPGEVIMQTFLSRGVESGNTNPSYLSLITATMRFSPDFFPSQWVVDMYDSTDIRKRAYFATVPVTVEALQTTAIVVNKFPGNPALFTGATTNYLNSVKVFRVAELYLIAAEAAYRSPAAGGEGAALTSLNALRVARGIGATAATGTALYQAIKDERFRELAFEGFRLWDLKRWHEGFTRRAPQNPALLTTGPNYTTKTVPADDPKFVWGIPTRDITSNPNLTQNPGW